MPYTPSPPVGTVKVLLAKAPSVSRVSVSKVTSVFVAVQIDWLPELVTKTIGVFMPAAILRDLHY